LTRSRASLNLREEHGRRMPTSAIEPARYLPFLEPSDRSMPGKLFGGLHGDAFGNGALDALHFQIDGRRPEYVEQRRCSTFQRSAGVLHACTADRTAHGVVLPWLARTLSAEHAGYFSRADVEASRLEDVVASLQEDLVIMRRSDAAAEARAVYLHVCFPSGWRPEEMVGRTFSAIHDKVPREGGFAGGRDRERYAHKLYGATRVRFVWTVTPDGALDRHPSSTATRSWRDPGEVHVRVERQVIAPLDAVHSVFLIRVHVYPVRGLGRRERGGLLAALDAMSPELRRYKGLADDEATIRELIAQAGQSA
jgi:dimethylamine monooxygenase subunit A